MITEEERQEIINAAVEKSMLALPEVVGNLILDKISTMKINRNFYSKFPEFRDKKDIVASVIEMVEGENPNVDYEELLKKAVPEIRSRIGTLKSLDIKTTPRPSRDLSKLNLDSGSDHGEL